LLPAGLLSALRNSAGTSVSCSARLLRPTRHLTLVFFLVFLILLGIIIVFIILSIKIIIHVLVFFQAVSPIATCGILRGHWKVV
jgi:hypothetical protein